MAKKRKVTRKRPRRPKPMRIAALIASAIRDLSDTKGSTPRKIIGYINFATNMPERRVKRQVNAALKRGVDYGILRRYRGHYFLPSGNEVDRANRIAVRFARLPTPAPRTGKSKSIANRRMTPAREYKKPQTLLDESPNGKKLERSRSRQFSGVSRLTSKPSIHDNQAE